MKQVTLARVDQQISEASARTHRSRTTPCTEKRSREGGCQVSSREVFGKQWREKAEQDRQEVNVPMTNSSCEDRFGIAGVRAPSLAQNSFLWCLISHERFVVLHHGAGHRPYLVRPKPALRGGQQSKQS